MPHEKLVSVEVSKGVHVQGYAFGQDDGGKIIVCLSKMELINAGLSCSGPCINRFYDKTKVTFLNGSVISLGKVEEDANGNNHRVNNPSGDSNGVLDNGNKKQKGTVKRKMVRRKVI